MFGPTVWFWTLAIITTTTSLVTGLFKYASGRYRHVLYVSLGAASQMIYMLFALLAQILFNTTFFYIAIIANMPMGLFAILLVDAMSSDHIDAKKVAVFVGTIVPIFMLMLEPDVIYIDFNQVGGPILQLGNRFLFMFFIYSVIINILYLLYSTKIHFNAPKILRKRTWIYFGGTVLHSIVAPAIFATFSQLNTPDSYLVPSISYLLGAIGGLITVIMLSMNPKLAFILPFKVMRLTVFETSSGIMLYNHTWRTKEDMINNELFSAMLQGIGLIVDEAVKKGSLEELVVTNGHIILKRSNTYPVAFVLVASKTSRALRAALDRFSSMFTTRFAEFLVQTREVTHFQEASSLVEACFPFLPEYP